MAVKVIGLHHHGIRVGPSREDVATALAFYQGVLGLNPDPGRPQIPSIDGCRCVTAARTGAGRMS